MCRYRAALAAKNSNIGRFFCHAQTVSQEIAVFCSLSQDACNTEWNLTPLSKLQSWLISFELGTGFPNTYRKEWSLCSEMGQTEIGLCLLQSKMSNILLAVQGSSICDPVTTWSFFCQIVWVCLAKIEKKKVKTLIETTLALLAKRAFALWAAYGLFVYQKWPCFQTFQNVAQCFDEKSLRTLR